jgi:outer membrane immunogenic protein
VIHHAGTIGLLGDWTVTKLLSRLAVAALAITTATTSFGALADGPVYSWTGLYAGVNGGYGFSGFNTSATPFANSVTGIPSATLQSDSDGAVFGGHLGWSTQFSNWVVGIEGDFNAASLSGSSQVVVADPLGGSGGAATDGYSVTHSVDWLASIRGRVGITTGASLFYITGGAAWESARDKVLANTETAAAVVSVSTIGNFSSTQSGWVLGAGYEWMLTRSWTLRGEYLHYGFGGSNNPLFVSNCAVFGAGVACGANIKTKGDDFDILRTGLSFKF